MPWDVILLPLLGGFWFVWGFYRTRFRAVQASRQVLIFFSASAAVVLLITARIIVLVMKEGPWGFSYMPGIIASLRDSFFPWPYIMLSATYFTSVTVKIVETQQPLFNKFIKYRGDSREVFFTLSWAKSSSTDHLILM